MTDKKRLQQKSPKRERQSKEARHAARAAGGLPVAGKQARDSDRFVEATHHVIEEEVRKGEAPLAPDPDQKREPGSSV